MKAERRIWETASTLVEFAGESAPSYASKWAHQLLEAGDIEARANWMRVMVACKVILAKDETSSRQETPRA
jgi:hypothetical protein